MSRGGRKGRAFLLLVLLLFPVSSFALSAREILDKAREVNQARKWQDQSQKVTMRIIDKKGREKVREIKGFLKGFVGDEEYKSINFFRSPPQVKGVGFLHWAHAHRDDLMWLYLPGIGRTRQISQAVMDQSYQQTDLSYRDLELVNEVQNWTEEEARSELLREEVLAGKKCFVIQLTPKEKDLPYSRVILWLSADDYLNYKLEIYDREGELFKVRLVEDYRDVQGFPTGHRLEFRTVPRGTKTIMEIAEVTYNNGLTDDFFTKRYLEREGW